MREWVPMIDRLSDRGTAELTEGKPPTELAPSPLREIESGASDTRHHALSGIRLSRPSASFGTLGLAVS